MSFVANRLELIHTLSIPQQWRYVPTDLKPADIGSRAVSPDEIDLADMWLHGSSFLFAVYENGLSQRFPNSLLWGPLFANVLFLRTPIICDITFVTQLISNNIN